jgi:hypothetical protein
MNDNAVPGPGTILMINYHDEEWGCGHDDNVLFEFSSSRCTGGLTQRAISTDRKPREAGGTAGCPRAHRGGHHPLRPSPASSGTGEVRLPSGTRRGPCAEGSDRLLLHRQFREPSSVIDEDISNRPRRTMINLKGSRSWSISVMPSYRPWGWSTITRDFRYRGNNGSRSYRVPHCSEAADR